MEDTIIKSFLDLGTTGAFLVYLFIKNGRQEKFNDKVVGAMDRNTKVLIKVATKHGYIDEADELMTKDL